MKLLWHLFCWELRLQSRSWRFRIALGLYLGGCGASLATVYFLGRIHTFGPTTYLQSLLQVQGFFTVLLAILVSGQRSSTSAWPEMWMVLASAPVGNGGYLLRRYGAMVGLVVPLTVVPMLAAAGLVYANGDRIHEVSAWFLGWAISILPVALIMLALWLGSVTILGSELAALLATAPGVFLLLAIINRFLLDHRLLVETSLSMGAIDGFFRWFNTATSLTREYGPNRDYFLSLMNASEAPFDAHTVLLQTSVRAAVALGAAIFVLAVGVAFVRRTRRDLRPWSVGERNPLHNSLKTIALWRQHMSPSAALSRRDIVIMACCALVLVGALGYDIKRQKFFQAMAWDRFHTESDDPFAPTDLGIKPVRWTIAGTLDADGAVDVTFSSRIVNEGEDLRERVAFMLNEHLELEDLETPGRRVAMKRRWDRLEITVEPPLLAGESLELRGRLTGTPAYVHFPFWSHGAESFWVSASNFRQARFTHELSDLAYSKTFRAAGAGRVNLEAQHLVPVPRYEPWTLTPRAQREGAEVPEEGFFPEAEIEIDLRAPAELFMADVCGQASAGEEGVSRLRSSCRYALGKYAVHGGRLEAIDDGGVIFAALPAHRARAEQYREALDEAARLSERAWPGVKGFRNMVAVEKIEPAGSKIRRSSGWAWRGFELRGNLLLVRENQLAAGELPNGERLVADLLSRDLLAQRPAADEAAAFFEHTIEVLMLQRMGVNRSAPLGRSQNALIYLKPPEIRDLLAEPLLEQGRTAYFHWRSRWSALLVDLRNRLGAKTFYDAVASFLEASDEPATVEGFFAHLERESGVPLARFHSDFVAGKGSVPELEFAGVGSSRHGDGFRISGRLRNRGTGEVVCPVVVKTEIATVKTMVEVGSQTEAPFELTTSSRPHTLHLDPEGTCFRAVTLMRDKIEKVDLLR